MVGVFVLHPERSSSSDKPSKAHVVHVILPITVMWRSGDEPTPETPFFIKKRKKKANMNSKTSLVLQKQVEEESESQGSNDKAPQITLEGPSCQAVACGLTNLLTWISEMIGPNIRVNESQLGVHGFNKYQRVPFKNGINSP